MMILLLRTDGKQATHHGWHNKGERPATIAFVMLGA